jgi:TDG/mug DNA glycosylase family protein
MIEPRNRRLWRNRRSAASLDEERKGDEFAMNERPSSGARPAILEDLLAPGLALVFCGTAAGTVSARLGQYYAHPQNRFWSTLKKTGLIPQDFDKAEFRKLLALGIGLADIAKYAFGMDGALPKGSLGEAACADLRRRIAAARPAFLAFTSLTGARAFLGAGARLGEQPEEKRIGATRLWALPSPSPAARSTWDETWWFALAEAARPYLGRSGVN